MFFVVTLIACMFCASLAYGYAVKKQQGALADMAERVKAHQEELQQLRDDKQQLQQHCADLDYQLRTTEKDLAAAEKRID